MVQKISWLALAAVVLASAPAGTARAEKSIPALGTLEGRWLRAEGGYVVEIRSVGPGGKLEAAYFDAVARETFDVHFVRMKP